MSRWSEDDEASSGRRNRKRVPQRRRRRPRSGEFVVSRAPGEVESKVVSEPLDLLGKWDDADLAVVVDATRSGSEPGTVQVVDLAVGNSAAPSAESIKLPWDGPARVLRLAQAMGDAPHRVVVVGIEGENFSDGVGLSPAVELAVSEAGELVLQVIGEATSMCMSRLHRAVADR